MSWWITLEDNEGTPIDTNEIIEAGGTYVFGGISEAELNVTYNYGKHFDFNMLDCLPAIDAIPVLNKAIDSLGNTRDNNYWKPTEGNVKATLKILLSFAEYAQTNKINSKFRVN